MSSQEANQSDKQPRKGRIAIEMARSSLGEITNVSASGLRVQHKGSRAAIPRKGRMFELQVQTLDGLVTIPAHVVWSKRTGFRRYDIGLAFGEADPSDLEKIRHMATMGARSRVITAGTGGAHLRAG